MILRWSVLGAAVLLNLPVLYAALVQQTVSVGSLVVRLAVTVPVVAVLLAGVRVATRAKDRT